MVSCSLSSPFSRIHSCLFSDWRRTVSLKFFDTQVISVSTEKLVLPRHARCFFLSSTLQRTQHAVMLLSLGLAESRILLQRLRTPVPEHLSSHSALSSYGLFAPLTLWRLSGPGPGKLPCFWGSMVFCHAPIPRKGSGNNNNGLVKSNSCIGMNCNN